MPRQAAPSPADSPLGISVSQTFLEFLQPIWQEVSHDPRAREGILQVGLLTWNAVALADLRGDKKWLEQIDARLPPGSGGERAVFEFLLERKRRDFAEHAWLVSDCGLFERDGEMRLRVEASGLPDEARG